MHRPRSAANGWSAHRAGSGAAPGPAHAAASRAARAAATSPRRRRRERRPTQDARQERRLHDLPHRDRRDAPCTRTRRSMLGCTDCHGGNATVAQAGGARRGSDRDYRAAMRTRARAAALSGGVALSVQRESGAHATRCSITRARSSCASSIRATTAWRAKPAAPAICRSSRRPSAA